ncbi:MAG: hypothetical protein E7667_07445 [Ruminococcaceae bacterium]|nr:hypothetical protein [Oscillospiraceae bacterium]
MAIYNCRQCGAILPYSGAPCSSCARKRADEQRWRNQSSSSSSSSNRGSSSYSGSRSTYTPGKYGTEHRASDGARYYGDFIKGKREGKGISEYWDGSKYVGEYLHDIQHGAGVYTYPNGTEYVGFWENGKRHGKGEINYLNGDVYTGFWENDKRHGWGMVVYPNGEKFDGFWKDDKRHGKGEIIYANGDKVSGIWENGELIGTLEPVSQADDGEMDISPDMLARFMQGGNIPQPQSASASRPQPEREIWLKLLPLTAEQRNDFLVSHPDITVPSGVDKIPDNMFKDCTNLRSIRFNQDLREIGTWAFKGCKNLGPDLVIPSGVERIRRFAFSNCSSIKKAILPNRITIEEAALMCSVTVVEFETNPPMGVVLEKGAFRYCNMTMSKEMQKKIKDLNPKAFK